jgi:hypothetical protein
VLIARQKIRYLVILNESFLTQITTLLAPKNNQVLLRIGITLSDYQIFTRSSGLIYILSPSFTSNAS